MEETTELTDAVMHELGELKEEDAYEVHTEMQQFLFAFIAT